MHNLHNCKSERCCVETGTEQLQEYVAEKTNAFAIELSSELLKNN